MAPAAEPTGSPTEIAEVVHRLMSSASTGQAARQAPGRLPELGEGGKEIQPDPQVPPYET